MTGQLVTPVQAGRHGAAIVLSDLYARSPHVS